MSAINACRWLQEACAALLKLGLPWSEIVGQLRQRISRPVMTSSQLEDDPSAEWLAVARLVPFPPAVAHRLLLSALSAAIAWPGIGLWR